jgi:hypothetical protein
MEKVQKPSNHDNIELFNDTFLVHSENCSGLIKPVG